MKKMFCVFGVLLVLCLCFASCGGHVCTDSNTDHKCDTCEAPMGAHMDGDDDDHFCDYGCGMVADDGCHGISDGVCDECGLVFASAQICVTVADKGDLALVRADVLAVDRNLDGSITIDEALYAAHEMYYEGGVSAGYASYMSEYGLSLGTLWGDNSGAFGYYVNNTSAMSLADEVSEGAYVYAYIYKDTTTWSDTYCYFEQAQISFRPGEEITLSLFTDTWGTVAPAALATITVNGIATDYVTDENGSVTLTLSEEGTFVIGATSTSATLTPPVCIAISDPQ